MSIQISQTAPETLLYGKQKRTGRRRRSSFLIEPFPECREDPITWEETEEKEINEKGVTIAQRARILSAGAFDEGPLILRPVLFV